MRRVLSIAACLLTAAGEAAPWIVAAACCAPLTSAAATPISFNINQRDGGRPSIDYTITNSNPGAIFNSATIQYLAKFSDSFAYALANNSSLQALGITTTSALLGSGFVGVSIGQLSNIEYVNNGWSATISSSTGVLSFDNDGTINGGIPNVDYDVWRSSTDGTPNTMQLTFTFGNQSNPDPKLKSLFDLNGDGLVQAEERLITEEQGWALLGLPAPPSAVVAAGFEGVMNINNTYTAELPRYWLLGAWWERMRAEGLARAALRVEREAGGGVSLRHGALAGLRYTVERSTTLAPGSFQPVGDAVTVPAPQELTHPLSDPGPGPVFYRLRIEVVED